MTEQVATLSILTKVTPQEEALWGAYAGAIRRLGRGAEEVGIAKEELWRLLEKCKKDDEMTRGQTLCPEGFDLVLGSSLTRAIETIWENLSDLHNVTSRMYAEVAQQCLGWNHHLVAQREQEARD